MNKVQKYKLNIMDYVTFWQTLAKCIDVFVVVLDSLTQTITV